MQNAKFKMQTRRASQGLALFAFCILNFALPHAMTPTTRFAPSPTGYLHLGHIVNAIYVWGLARTLAGRVLLRIEDHDRIRSRREFEAAILEDWA